jgi:hypothetical protein
MCGRVHRTSWVRDSSSSERYITADIAHTVRPAARYTCSRAWFEHKQCGSEGPEGSCRPRWAYWHRRATCGGTGELSRAVGRAVGYWWQSIVEVQSEELLTQFVSFVTLVLSYCTHRAHYLSAGDCFVRQHSPWIGTLLDTSNVPIQGECWFVHSLRAVFRVRSRSVRARASYIQHVEGSHRKSGEMYVGGVYSYKKTKNTNKNIVMMPLLVPAG